MKSSCCRLGVFLILALGIACARSSAAPEPAALGQYNFYLGNLHSHSIYSGDQAKTVAEKENNGVARYDVMTPADVFNKAAACGYDFYAVTDHSSPEQNPFYAAGFTEPHWRDTLAQADKFTSSTFVGLYGFEFSRNVDNEKGGRGHMNIINTPAWKSAYAPGNTFAAIYGWLTAQDNGLIAAQFNHPGAPGEITAPNYNNYAGRTKPINDILCLVEIWNSTDKMGYVPVIRKIWAAGWKVAPVGGTDVHGIWGIEKRTLRAGVLADSLTRDDLMRAIRARRVYATVEPRLQLEFRLNNSIMGTAFERRPAGPLQVQIFADNPGGAAIERAEIFGARYDTNGGGTELLATLTPGAADHVARAEVANGYDFYYAAVYKTGKADAVAFSAPVWMDNL